MLPQHSFLLFLFNHLATYEANKNSRVAEEGLLNAKKKVIAILRSYLVALDANEPWTRPSNFQDALDVLCVEDNLALLKAWYDEAKNDDNAIKLGLNKYDLRALRNQPAENAFERQYREHYQTKTRSYWFGRGKRADFYRHEISCCTAWSPCLFVGRKPGWNHALKGYIPAELSDPISNIDEAFRDLVSEPDAVDVPGEVHEVIDAAPEQRPAANIEASLDQRYPKQADRTRLNGSLFKSFWHVAQIFSYDLLVAHAEFSAEAIQGGYLKGLRKSQSELILNLRNAEVDLKALANQLSSTLLGPVIN